MRRIVRVRLRDESRVGVRRRPALHADVTASAHDALERLAIDDEVLDDRERLRAPRLDPDLVAVLEAPHVELAARRTGVGPVRDAVDDE